MKSLLLAGLIALSAALPAAANDWRYTINDGEKSILIDVDSIVSIPGGFEYTQVMNYPDRDFVSRVQMLCRQKKVRTVQYYTYDKSGRLVQSESNSKREFQNILVNSVIAADWQFLCQ